MFKKQPLSIVLISCAVIILGILTLTMRDATARRAGYSLPEYEVIPAGRSDGTFAAFNVDRNSNAL